MMKKYVRAPRCIYLLYLIFRSFLPAVFVVHETNAFHADAKNSSACQTNIGVDRSGLDNQVPVARSPRVPVENVLNAGESIEDKIQKNLFIRVVPSKTRCYVGENVEVTYKLYSRLDARSRVVKQPSLTGFGVQRMNDHIALNASVEKLHGKPYQVHTLKAMCLVPLQTGLLELGTIELESAVRFKTLPDRPSGRRRHYDDIFEQILQEEAAPEISRNMKIASERVAITVCSLPIANRPEDFSGAIGQFDVSASTSSAKPFNNDAVSLKVEIRGTGNLSLIDAPSVAWPSNIEMLGVQSAKQTAGVIPKDGVGRVFEYTFIPEKAGKYTIRPVSFCYFDPETGAYKTVHSKPVVFHAASDEFVTYADDKRQSPLKSTKSGNLSRRLAYTKPHNLWFFTALISMMCALSLCLWRLRPRGLQKETGPAGLVKGAQALSGAQLQKAEADPLTPVRDMAARHEYAAFYAALNNILWQLLAQKTNLPPSALNQHNIAAFLILKGHTQEFINVLMTLLIACEKNIYIPDYSIETDPDAHLQNAGIIIESLGKL